MQKSYTRKLKQPNNIQEGFQNKLQMIINKIEADDKREALMLSVDMLDDISGSLFTIKNNY